MRGRLRRLLFGSTPRCRARHHAFRDYRCRGIVGHAERHNFGWANIGNLTLDLDVEIVSVPQRPGPLPDFDG